MYTHDLRPSLINTPDRHDLHDRLRRRRSTARRCLQNTASGAGGQFYEAKDTATLSTVLTSITRDILSFNTSFTAPAVSVNAFNRTQNLNDLYITVFRPSETYNWDGNIKKYKLDADRRHRGRQRSAGGRSHDRLLQDDTRAATGATWWTATGWTSAAPRTSCRRRHRARSTATSTRRVALTAAGNQIVTTNAAITTALLGLGADGSTRHATT